MAKKDRLLAKLAHTHKLAPVEQINRCISLLTQHHKHGRNTTLDAVLIEEGVLSGAEVARLLPEVEAELARLEPPAPPEIPVVSIDDEPATAAPPDPLVGTTVGGYRVLERIGRGAMGVIYRAEQVALERIVALKMLDPALAADPAFLERFLGEARAVAQLNHPNLIQIYDVVADGQRIYFSMEYVAGRSAGRLLDEQGKLAPEQALDIVIQVATALREAHRHGIVHRDVKPDNILLAPDGVAKLSDLGIAKRGEGAEAGGPVGTPYYISPEQAFDSNAVDGRADIYSLGASFFHMVTGELPFSGSHVSTVLMKQAKLPVPSASERNSAVPFELDLAIRKMMDKDPDGRYPDAATLLEALEAIESSLAGDAPAARRKPLLERSAQITIAVPDAETSFELADDSRAGLPAVAASLPSQDEIGIVDSDRRPAASPPAASAAEPAAVAAPEDAPPEKPSPPKALLGVLAVLLLIGLVTWLTGGKSKKEEPPRQQASKSAPKPKPPPQKKQKKKKAKKKKPELTPEQKAEQEAKQRWQPLQQVAPPRLEDAALAEHKAALEGLLRDFPKGSIAPRVKQALAGVERELELREFRSIAAGIDQSLAAGKYREAASRLQQVLAGLAPRHSQKERYRQKLQQAKQQAQRALQRTLQQAEERRRQGKPEEAGKLIEAALPQQTDEHRKQLAEKQQQIRAELLAARRALQLELYEPYYRDLSQSLFGQQYDKALARARTAFTGTLAEALSRDEELADLTALAAAWRLLEETLRAKVGQAVALRFVGEKKAETVKIVRVARDTITLSTSLQRFAKLHQESLAELCGPALGVDPALRRLRLSFLLHTLEREEEAQALLDTLRDAPAHDRFELRPLCGRLSRIRAAMAPKNKKLPQWLAVLADLGPLLEHHARSPYWEATHKQRQRWVVQVKHHLGAGMLAKQAKLAHKSRRYKTFREYAGYLELLYPKSRAAEEVRKLQAPGK